MSCERIGTIDNAGEPQQFIASLIGNDVRSVCTVSNDKLCPVTEEVELWILATLTSKLMEKNLNCLLSTRLLMHQPFYPFKYDQL